MQEALRVANDLERRLSQGENDIVNKITEKTTKTSESPKNLEEDESLKKSDETESPKKTEESELPKKSEEAEKPVEQIPRLPASKLITNVQKLDSKTPKEDKSEPSPKTFTKPGSNISIPVLKSIPALEFVKRSPRRFSFSLRPKESPKNLGRPSSVEGKSPKGRSPRFLQRKISFFIYMDGISHFFLNEDTQKLFKQILKIHLMKLQKVCKKYCNKSKRKSFQFLHSKLYIHYPKSRKL